MTMPLNGSKNLHPKITMSQRIDTLAREIAQAQLMSGDRSFFYTPYIPTFTKPKYQFTRTNWYTAEYDDCYYDEVRAWCTEQFGPQPAVADAWTRWHHKYHNIVFFRDEKDYIWFTLRWSS